MELRNKLPKLIAQESEASCKLNAIDLVVVIGGHGPRRLNQKWRRPWAVKARNHALCPQEFTFLKKKVTDKYLCSVRVSIVQVGQPDLQLYGIGNVMRPLVARPCAQSGNDRVQCCSAGGLTLGNQPAM